MVLHRGVRPCGFPWRSSSAEPNDVSRILGFAVSRISFGQLKDTTIGPLDRWGLFKIEIMKLIGP